MYSELKYAGDAGYIAEDLLPEKSEWFLQSQLVEKVVAGGYFTLDQALHIYKVNEVEYMAYMLLRVRNKSGATDKQAQLEEILHLAIHLFTPSSASFDQKGQEIMRELQNIAV